jgi:hypothetical protein
VSGWAGRIDIEENLNFERWGVLKCPLIILPSLFLNPSSKMVELKREKVVRMSSLRK